MSTSKSNRREFVKNSTRGALGLTAVGAWSASILGANDRIRIGLIGCGSRGNYLMGRVLHCASELNVEIAAAVVAGIGAGCGPGVDTSHWY